MISKAIWRMALRIGVLAAFTMINYGCNTNKPEKTTSYNLKFVACSPDKTVEVEIKSGQVAPADQYIFVCVGDKVRWYTEDDLTFTAKFDDTAALKSNTLFESGEGSFTSKPDTGPGVADKHHKQVTDTQTVSKNVTLYQDYSYQVLARDKNGESVSTNDPHVIPMGK